jgi:hypothetical protein
MKKPNYDFIFSDQLPESPSDKLKEKAEIARKNYQARKKNFNPGKRLMQVMNDGLRAR